MCLSLKKNYSVKTADKDIVCYKVMVGYRTPYMDTPLPEEILSGDAYFYAEGALDIRRSIFDFKLNGGAIHTYTSYRSALHDANYMRIYEHRCGVCIYKCIIPKGCEYYKGTTEVINPMGTTYGALVYQAESYASLRIKFVSLVKKFLIE